MTVVPSPFSLPVFRLSYVIKKPSSYNFTFHMVWILFPEVHQGAVSCMFPSAGGITVLLNAVIDNRKCVSRRRTVTGVQVLALRQLPLGFN